jgi:hypothetical protein
MASYRVLLLALILSIWDHYGVSAYQRAGTATVRQVLSKKSTGSRLGPDALVNLYRKYGIPWDENLSKRSVNLPIRRRATGKLSHSAAAVLKI